MDQKSFHGLGQGINEDLSLSQVTIYDSTSSYCPITNTAFDYDPVLFQTCSQPEAFNISQFALSSLQPLAQPWSFTDNPTMSNGNINYPVSPSDLIPLPTKRPSISTSVHSTATTGTSGPSKQTSTHTAHSNGLPPRSENRISRRRAQNCAAQRAFRARKEDSLKESSMRFEILKIKFERLEGDNGSLNNIVDGLRGEIDGLRRGHGAWR
jgi:hypothetical protein